MTGKNVSDKLKAARKLKAEAFSYSASLLAKTAALDAAANDLARLSYEVARLQRELAKANRRQLWSAILGTLAGIVLAAGIWECFNQ